MRNRHPIKTVSRNRSPAVNVTVDTSALLRELLNIVCDGYDGSNDENENNFSSNGGGGGEGLEKEHTYIISNFSKEFSDTMGNGWNVCCFHARSVCPYRFPIVDMLTIEQ